MCAINTGISGNKNLKIRHWRDFQWKGMRQKTREGFFFEEEDGSLPVDLPPTPTPPALNKKSSIMLNQHDQIEGVSYSALAENPLRAADRVSTLIKS